jgi:hypothetical protein
MAKTLLLLLNLIAAIIAVFGKPREPSLSLVGTNGTTYHLPGAMNYTGQITRSNTTEVKQPDTNAKLYIKDKHGKMHLVYSGNNQTLADHNHVATMVTNYAQANNITGNSTNLNKRLAGPPPVYCWNTWSQGFDQNSWGYYNGNWGQMGGCYYCESCYITVDVSYGVSFTYTAEADLNLGNVISGSFGYSWGHSWGTDSAFTCYWVSGSQLANGATNYGCNSIWFQPLYSWHWGYTWWQSGVACSDGRPWVQTGYNWADMMVSQPVLDQYGNAAGNFGCGSGCFNAANYCNPFGWDCCHQDSGATMGW